MTALILYRKDFKNTPMKNLTYKLAFISVSVFWKQWFKFFLTVNRNSEDPDDLPNFNFRYNEVYSNNYYLFLSNKGNFSG